MDVDAQIVAKSGAGARLCRRKSPMMVARQLIAARLYVEDGEPRRTVATSRAASELDVCLTVRRERRLRSHPGRVSVNTASEGFTRTGSQ
jgi:hypothetical protein